MDGIFISYRRDDASGYAGRLYDRLKAHFGDDRVFMDVAEIEPGTDFVEAIERAVGSCRVLIVLIGDEWLAIRDAQGRRRLDDPHDFIRLEVAAALKRGIRVVPVVLDRATTPRAEDLPEELKPLARRQAITLQHNQWEGSTATLVHALERALGERHAPLDGGWAARRVPTLAWALAAVSALAAGGGAWWWMRPTLSEAPAPGDTQVAGRLNPSSAPPAGNPSGKQALVARAPAPAPVAVSTPTAPRAPPTPAPAPEARTRVAPTPAPVASPAAAPKPAPVPAPTPAPALAPTPAPAPKPALAPTPAPQAAPPALDAALPQPGHSWTYRVKGKWPTSPNRSVVITVSEVRDGLVVDRLSDPEASAAVQRRSRAGQGGFVQWPGIGTEFSPYLASQDLTGWRGRGFSTPDVDGQWTQWHSQGAAIGREAVTVPAGLFEAVKVEVWSSRTPTGSPASMAIEPVRIHYLVWYSPQVRRYVRMQRRVISAAGQEMERDVFELVSRQGG